MPTRRARRLLTPIPRQVVVRLCALLTVASSCLLAATASALPLVIQTTTLADGTAGVAYSDAIVASSGTEPYAWSVVDGGLPGGIALDGGNGALSGTATLAGSSPFIVLVTDAVGDTATRALSITIAPAAASALSFATGPSDVLAGAAIAPAVQVKVEDAFANAVPGALVSLALVGSGTLSGGAAVASDANGLATFGALSVDAPGSKQLSASSGALGPVTSGPFTVTAPPIPAAVGDLAATRVTAGNDGDGTTKIQLNFTPAAFAASVEVYRAAFGGYPRYDDAGGLTPPTPSYPPGAPWVITPVSASGQSDAPATRDAFAYVLFSKNALGQVSAVSNQTPEVPDYALGDVSDGITAGAGDNLVNDLDISLLGAHYGITGATLLSAGVSYLDVGPTLDLSVSSRPFTDGRIDFEDLVVFATNYGTVSAPSTLVASAEAAARAATAPEVLSVEAPAVVQAGETFDAMVHMAAAGRVQGLSTELGWDAAIAEPVAVAGAGWVEAQHGVVWSARPGTFDAVLLGARARGLAGSGDLARVTFRARGAGDPAIRIARVLARDAANRPLAERLLSFGAPAAAPAHTLLLAPAPNPGRGARTLSFALAQPGDVDLAIYSVDGRRVRTLAHGAFAAGTYHLTWPGDDEQHRAAAPGLYFAQLVTGGRRYSRMLVHL